MAKPVNNQLSPQPPEFYELNPQGYYDYIQNKTTNANSLNSDNILSDRLYYIEGAPELKTPLNWW